VSLLIARRGVLAAGAAPVAPDPGNGNGDLPVTTGLLQHVDANDLTLSNNDPVPQWDDLSGNGYHKTQSSSSSQPIYVASGIGSLPCVGFVDERRMTVSGGVPLASGTSLTEFIVVEPTSFSGTNHGFWRVGSSSTGTSFFILQGSGKRPWVRWNGTDILQPGSGYAVALDVPVLLTLRIENASYVEFRADGQAEHSASHSASIGSVGVFNFFYQSGINERVDGLYGERVVYDRYLSNSEVVDMETYLMAKWGLD
jgi:hypothetical protein